MYGIMPSAGHKAPRKTALLPPPVLPVKIVEMQGTVLSGGHPALNGQKASLLQRRGIPDKVLRQ